MSTPSSYSDCVASLRTSLSFLESSVSTLGNGIEDYPRLGAVLKTVRVCLSSIHSHIFPLNPQLTLTNHSTMN